MRPTIVWDLDNTLCECGVYYVQAHSEFVQLAQLETGLPPEVCLDVLNKLDVAATKLPNGWGMWRLPASYAAAMQALHRLADKHCAAIVDGEARRIARRVFDAPYTLYPLVREVLDHYRTGGWQQLLVTKGDRELQERKIARHGLRDLFDAVHIVPRKSEGVLAAILVEHQVDRSRSWAVGDSPKDDIGPALACGLRTVEVTDQGGRWAYEDQDHFAHAKISVIGDVLDHIPRMPAGRTAQAVT